MGDHEPPPEGWYEDPERPGTERWWDGQQWTDQRRDADEGQTSWGDRLRSAAEVAQTAASTAKEAYDGRQRGKAVEEAGGEEPIVTLTSHDPGKNAVVSLFPDRIERVKERSLLSFSSANQDAEVIPISRVSHVRTQKKGFRTNVYVTVSGEDIVFRVSHEEAKNFKDAITQQLLGQDAGQPSANRNQDDADQIRKLARLRDEGILSEEEFQAKKRQILDL